MQQISIDPKAVAGNTGPDGTNNTCAAIPENRLTRRSVLGSRLICFQIGNEPEYYKNDNTRLRGPDWAPTGILRNISPNGHHSPSPSSGVCPKRVLAGQT